MAQSMYSLLAGAINHPDAIKPYQGLFNHRIIASLTAAGVDLEAVSPRPFAPPIGPYSAYASLPKTEAWGTYTVHHPRIWYLLPKRLFYWATGNSYAKRVPPYVERTFEPPDVLHACHIYPDGYGLLPYAREHDIPLFVVSHGTLLNTFEDLPVGVAGKIRETLEGATGVCCVSDDLARTARTLTDPAKVSTVPIGADPDRFPVEDRRRIRDELDVPAGATVVLFVGRFTERKGVEEILEVLPALSGGDVTFVFVGTRGPLEAELREFFRENPSTAGVVYDGLSPEELRRWYAIADLLLLPSHSEGRPTVIYEAMASETAVLASNVGGIPEQVVDGETGVLIPPGDVDRLRESLDRLVGDRESLEAMGARGLARLRDQEWTWADHAERLMALHQEAIE